MIMKVFEQMKRIITVPTENSQSNQNEEVCLAAHVFANQSEGLEQTVQKVFETNHPYEKGKLIQFD